MYKHKFGIVTSFYNTEEFVDSVFESILNQTYKNWVYFVTDDGSSDRTKEKILKYCDNIKIFYVEQKFKKEMFWQPQRFITEDCDYLITMDSDDYVLPKALEVYNNALNEYKDKNIVFISCDSAWMNDKMTSLLNYTYVYHDKSYYLNDNDVERNRRGIDRISPNTFGSFRGIKNIKGLDFGVNSYNAAGNNDMLHTGLLQNFGNSLIIQRNLYKYRYRTNSISHKILNNNEWNHTVLIRDILKDKVTNFDCRVINMEFKNLYTDFCSLLMCEELANINSDYRVNLITKFINKDFSHLKNLYKEHFIDINNFVDDFDFYVLNLTDYDLDNKDEIKKIINYVKSKNFYKIVLYYHDRRDSSEIESNPKYNIEKIDKILSQYFSTYYWASYYRNTSYMSENLNYVNIKNSINIVNESPSLGDCIAWVPIVNEFAIKNRTKVNLYTPNKEIFVNEYPMINFFNYSEKPENNNISIGCFDDKKWRPISLQQVACDILKLDNKEIRCKLDFNKTKKSNFNKKYVCIATQSTGQYKYWNRENGWIQVVDYLKNLGYDVVCIDKHYSFGNAEKMNVIPYNAINKTGDLPLEDRINDLYHCEFFIGLGSGLSWLAWACEKPVIMISGFSDPISEFYTPYRVHNKNVCNSCWNDFTCTFDRSNWLWCPRNKNFECSREITFDMVKEKIDLCIKDLSNK
jgi:autotransporter strand-loop-strand O-heptosyltransferase